MTHPLSQNPFGENTLLDALLAASSDVMLICHSDAGGSGTIIAASDAALSRLGYRRKELLELELNELTDDLSSDRLFSESSKDSSFVEGSQGLRCKNGDFLTGQLKVQRIAQKEVELVLLALKEQSFTNHFRHLPVPIFIWKRENGAFVLRDCNDAAKQITQGRTEKIFGLTAEQLYSTPESRHLVDSLRRCYSSGQTIQREFLYRLTTTGATKWIRGTWVKLDTDTIALHTEDITERKQAELALEKTKNKLESTLAALPDLFFEVDRSGKLLSYSTNDDSKLFRDPMEWLGRNVEEVLPAEAAKIIMDAVAEADETGTHHGAQYGLELPAGQRWFELSIAKNPQATEDRGRFVVLAHDVSQRVKTESSLAKSESNYREMIETAYEGIWQIDTEGLTTFVNERLLDMLGYREEEMLGRPFFDFMSKSERALAREYFQHRADGLAEQHEFTFCRKDGTDIHTLISASPIATDGRFSGALAMVTDISERIQAEKALRISEQKLASVLDNVQDVIWSMSWPDLELIYLSPSVENIYGYSVDQLFSQPDLWFTATHPDDRGRVDEIMETLKKKGKSERKHRVTRPDGKIIWLLNKSHLIYNEKGEPIRIDGVATDISELQVLKGLLPICYSCKKIRDDDGYWHEVDAYITKNADVWFSHGLCQECFHELFPDIDGDSIEGKAEDSIDPQKRDRFS